MPSNVLTLTPSFSLGWTNPNNALTSNNSYATYTDNSAGGANSYFGFSTNAGSILLSDAVIVGVIVQVEYRANTITPQPRITAGPGSFGGTKDDTLVSTVDTIYTIGSASDSNGAAVVADVTEISVKFGKNLSGTVTYYFDNITATVYWDYASNINKANVLFFGENF